VLVLPFISRVHVLAWIVWGEAVSWMIRSGCCCSGQSCTSRTATATDLPRRPYSFALAGVFHQQASYQQKEMFENPTIGEKK